MDLVHVSPVQPSHGANGSVTCVRASSGLVVVASDLSAGNTCQEVTMPLHLEFDPLFLEGGGWGVASLRQPCNLQAPKATQGWRLQHR